MERLRFANQLRGVAALSVAASHMVAIYWAVPDVVSWVTRSVAPSPAQMGPDPILFRVLNQAWFQPGPFGVALFFLISGLVIPFSLEKHGRLSFVAARLLRIFPTYLAALALGMAAIWLSSRFWALPFGWTLQTVASNASLTYDLLGEPSVDLVNWTLSVELKFYLLMMLLAPAIRRGSAPALIAVAGGICAANALRAAGLIGHSPAISSHPTYTLSSHSLCLIYMLMGVAFNFRLRGALGRRGLLLCLGLLGAIFIATWRISVWREQFPAVTLDYAYALAVFAALYRWRGRIPPSRALDAMAAISFPFYALHTLIGLTTMRFLMAALSMPYYAALAAAVAIVGALAWLLHGLVERPSIAAGRALALYRPGRSRSPRVYPEQETRLGAPASRP